MTGLERGLTYPFQLWGLFAFAGGFFRIFHLAMTWTLAGAYFPPSAHAECVLQALLDSVSMAGGLLSYDNFGKARRGEPPRWLAGCVVAVVASETLASALFRFNLTPIVAMGWRWPAAVFGAGIIAVSLNGWPPRKRRAAQS